MVAISGRVRNLGMKLRPGPLITVCVLAVAAGCAIAALSNHVSKVPVYTVAATHAALTRAPERWVGRTFYVRGRLEGCPPVPAPCPIWQLRLFDPGRATAREALPVEQSPDPLQVFLHRMPLVGKLFPAPHVTHWGAVGIYRVQFRALPIVHCLTSYCEPGVDYDVFYCDLSACYKLLLLQGID